MGYLLGIDGGGTRTTAWLADEDLRILARVTGGPSNPIKVGVAAAQHELAQVYRGVLREGRIQHRKLDAVCAGLAGADGEPVRGQMLRWIRRYIPARAHLLTTDAAITLEAALGGSEGIIVIAGTGSISFARDEKGEVFRVGGWGSLFDDAGSGYDIGRKAIAAALRAHDGRGRPTGLLERFCRKLRLRKITEVVTKDFTTQDIAALFPLVHQEAIAGDVVARRLCFEAAENLAELPITLLKRLGWKRRPVQVVCSGGIFRSSALIRRAFARKVHEYGPRTRITLLQREPVEGALLLARQLACSESTRPTRPGGEA
ncbi:MAG TPA: BadF/BadG/BcrA/BcrD ATPase family protein [Terriglobia bacterium]|nr:BadF/BadG/BcrA/BcrD ATPase family protein [Terriglobia bacterium]